MAARGSAVPFHILSSFRVALHFVWHGLRAVVSQFENHACLHGKRVARRPPLVFVCQWAGPLPVIVCAFRSRHKQIRAARCSRAAGCTRSPPRPLGRRCVECFQRRRADARMDCIQSSPAPCRCQFGLAPVACRARAAPRPRVSGADALARAARRARGVAWGGARRRAGAETGRRDRDVRGDGAPADVSGGLADL